MNILLVAATKEEIDTKLFKNYSILISTLVLQTVVSNLPNSY